MSEPTEHDIERALTEPGTPVFEALEDTDAAVEAMADDVTSPALRTPNTGPPDPLTPTFQEPAGAEES